MITWIKHVSWFLWTMTACVSELKHEQLKSLEFGEISTKRMSHCNVSTSSECICECVIMTYLIKKKKKNRRPYCRSH